MRHGHRHRQAKPRRHAVEAHGGTHVERVIAHIGRHFGELPEIRIAVRERHVHGAQVCGRHVKAHVPGIPWRIHDIRETNVVHPHFERVAGKNAARAHAAGIHAHNADGEFLHCRQIGRTHRWVHRVHDIAIGARGTPTRRLTERNSARRDEHRIHTRARNGVRAILQIRVLQLRAQRNEFIEIHAYFWEPGGLTVPGVHGRAIGIEVVGIASDLHIELQFAVLPPAVAAATSPGAQFLVLLKIPRALRKAIIRLGAFVLAELGRGQP